MGYLELDHDPSIARMKLLSEISAVGENVMERTRDWVAFVRENPDAGYTVNETPSETDGVAPLTVISNPDGIPVVTYRDKSFMQIHGAPDSTGRSQIVRTDQFQVSLYSALGAQEFLSSSAGYTLGPGSHEQDRAYASMTQSKQALSRMPRPPKPPAPTRA
jgi:hypothetical protein